MTDTPAGRALESSLPDDSHRWSTIGIGETARILDQEFGDVSISKIRYLESRGLISPTRTRGGSRRYSGSDLDRLRFIIRCQRVHFLPLDEISRRLSAEATVDEPQAMDQPVHHEHDPKDSSLGPRPPTHVGTLAHMLRPAADAQRSTMLTPEQFLQLCGCRPELVEQMRQHGLDIECCEDDVALCQSLDRLHRFGIDPRHLRWLTQSTQRAVALVDASIPRRRGSTARTEAEMDEARRLVAADLIATYVLLIRKAMTGPTSAS